MTAVTYLEGRPRDPRGEQECILTLFIMHAFEAVSARPSEGPR